MDLEDSKYETFKATYLVGWACIAALLFLNTVNANAQVNVYPTQNISFGAFFPGNSGGTLTISPDGTRSSTGDIIPMNMGFVYSPAVFEIEAPQDAVISILKGPDVILTGSNGGSLTLHIGDADVGSSFNNTVAPPGRTQIKMGGTLTVAGSTSTPPGNYNGTISITFIQE
jgi:hypothetical protein